MAKEGLILTSFVWTSFCSPRKFKSCVRHCRYLQNVCLLEEVFWVNTEFDDQIEDEKSSSEDMVDDLKLRLRSNTSTESFRKRIQCIVDEGLTKVRKLELIDEVEDASDSEGQGRRTKKVKSLQNVKTTALSELNDKLNRARNEDELKVCWEMASEIFEWNAKKSQREAADDHDPCTKRKTHIFPPKWVNPFTIDKETLSRIDVQFSSLQEIEDL